VVDCGGVPGNAGAGCNRTSLLNEIGVAFVRGGDGDIRRVRHRIALSLLTAFLAHLKTVALPRRTATTAAALARSSQRRRGMLRVWACVNISSRVADNPALQRHRRA